MSHTVHPGDRGLPAAQLNRAFAAADMVLSGQGRPVPAPSRSGGVWVQNNSGGTLDQFGVVGVFGVAWTPTDNADSFAAGPVLTVTTPTTADHRGRFGILPAPIAGGKVGRAVFSGVQVAKIVVASDSHRYADVKSADATALQTTAHGGAKILWMESSGSVRWAVVELGAEPVCEFDAKITGEAANGDSRWKYAWTEQERTAAGWADLTGGRSGTTTTGFALNRAEAYNAATGVQGNGVDLDGGTFTANPGLALKPIRGGRVVRMVAEYDSAGGVAYSFSASSAIDGECV